MSTLNSSALHTPSTRRRTLPKGTPQVAALLLLFVVNALIADNFFSIHIQEGRLFGSVIDIFNRGAPVALLTLGMTLVIATGGIDLSVGAVMAISGAVTASLAQHGYAPGTILLCA
ncbi:ABC transporter permease subunit, partial [Vibrio diabolicus]